MNNLLKIAFRLNALSCIGFGAVFFFAPDAVAAFLGGLAPDILRWIGIGLWINGLHLALASLRQAMRRGEVIYFVLGDAAWVLGSLVLVLPGVGLIHNPWAIAATLAVALIVGTLGALQARWGWGIPVPPKALRVLVLDGHPDARSLCSALAGNAAEAAEARGAEVKLLHLSDMVFDPNLSSGYKQRQDMEPDLLMFLDAVRWCDTLILVHPMWWGSAPAKLKGLIDRVFLPGIAFAFEGGGYFPQKLFKGRTARVLITTDTPAWYLWLGYRNGWLNVLRRQILGFVGLRVTHMKTIGPIRGATPDAINSFKEAARKLGN